MTSKHWTEPNGIFIVNIPTKWQYRNPIIDDVEEKSPYSFEAYENSPGCYPLSERGINPTIPVQKSNAQIKWLESRMDDDEFDVYLWHAQVEDQLCMAKCIYSRTDRKRSKIKKLLKSVRKSLESLRVIPKSERLHAIALNKYDNFIFSLASSYDLREKAFESNSYIEIIAIISNQIDAFLRISIVLRKQLNAKTKEIEVKYLFQEEDERGITERKIYKDAFSLEIIDQELLDRLNSLYDMRNRVIHRYIISYLKTVDIVEATINYIIISEEIRMILKSLEDEQINKQIGIYGKGFIKDYEFTMEDQQIAFAMANDKHMMDEFYRKIE